MAQITEKLIDMIFPTIKCEVLYRNSLIVLKANLDRYYEEYIKYISIN